MYSFIFFIILILIRLVIISLIFSLILLNLTLFLRNKIIQDREITRPFECGFSIKDTRRLPFSLRFFIVALIFLIFDVELLILFPFLRRFIFSRNFIRLIIYFSFLYILSLGLFYEWNNFILEWIKFLR